MELEEAKSVAQALCLQAASLAGLRASSISIESLGLLVLEGFDKVTPTRRPEAVANLLRFIAVMIQMAQDQGVPILTEHSVGDAKERVCPIYPFGSEED